MNQQTSESFKNSMLLALSGGLQDAYTYNTRGGVFANAQTGNVVLMSQNLMTGNVSSALRYLLPLLAFAGGVFAAERIGHRYKYAKRLHWRQGVLLIEILILAAVAFLPKSLNMPANILVSFSCAMQVQSFRKVDGYGYASTMCIGNLRSGTDALSKYLRSRERGYLSAVLRYYGIITLFAVGAGAGGILSQYAGLRSILVSCVLLGVSFLLMRNR